MLMQDKQNVETLDRRKQETTLSHWHTSTAEERRPIRVALAAATA